MVKRGPSRDGAPPRQGGDRTPHPLLNSCMCAFMAVLNERQEQHRLDVLPVTQLDIPRTPSPSDFAVVSDYRRATSAYREQVRLILLRRKSMLG